MAQTIKEYLDGKRGNTSLPNDFRAEFSEYTQVDNDDKAGRKWFKVYWIGNDSKYGAFMICPDTKEWRNPTMMEFYGVLA